MIKSVAKTGPTRIRFNFPSLSLSLLNVQIDYLVNNAGRSQRAEAVCTELNVDRALMDLNVLSTISLTKAVLPKMLEKREGSIVVISSVAGKLGTHGMCHS